VIVCGGKDERLRFLDDIFMFICLLDKWVKIKGGKSVLSRAGFAVYLYSN